jgi:hypothetical protein
MSDMPARLDAVLTVIYLVFTEGYAATRGEALVRTDLCAEAIRLGRLVRRPSWRSCSCTIHGTMRVSMRPAISSFSTSRIGAAGIRR